jgi:superfamily II DNA/RNA helicase
VKNSARAFWHARLTFVLKDKNMLFKELDLHPNLQKAVAEAGYETATEVQAQAIPLMLAARDVLAQSATGSGKTAAFALPALQKFIGGKAIDANTAKDGSPLDRATGSAGKRKGPRVLVLAPTRELALQVSKAFSTYGKHVKGLRVATVVGGVPYGAQLKALRGPLDVLIATPGRLLDHLDNRVADLSGVEMLVLDEADRMLDMGFIEDIEAIAAKTPSTRQTVMFSATFAGNVGALAMRMTRDAHKVEIATHTDTHENITQRLHWADDFTHKNALLDHVLCDVEVEQAIVFTSTQRDAEKLAFRLEDMGHKVAALHGGMPQGKRNRTLTNLRHGNLRVLVATDVAARGIDVPSISHVINYGMPMNPEDYVHRIGRTGRAGRSGLAITIAQADDVGMIRRIERFTTQKMPVAAITGLEPKKPEPRNGSGGFGGAGRKPSGGGKSGGRGRPSTHSAKGRSTFTPSQTRNAGGDNASNSFSRDGARDGARSYAKPAHAERRASFGANQSRNNTGGFRAGGAQGQARPARSRSY